MKVVTKTINSISQSSAGDKKHLIYFFGLGESIKANNECNDWGKWVSNKNIDIHLFGYHYMNSFYPEHFHDTRFRLKQALITIIAASIVGFISYSIIVSKMSIWLKVPVFMVFLTPAIIVVGIMASYSFITSLIKFATKGKDPVKAGVAIAIDLLEKGVHPDNIILMGNSLGGGIAAEVLEKFEEEKIYFTFIHSNSYDSWKNVLRSHKSFVGTLSKRISVIVDIWFKLCNLNYKPNEIIKSTEAPVLATNRMGDIVIDEAAQSVFNLQKSKGEPKNSSNGSLKVTALLKHNSTGNIHVEKLTSMVIDRINYLESQEENLNNSKTYEELLENFINEAHEYLKENRLNKEFKLNTFQHNKLYQERKKNKVSLINTYSPNSNLNASTPMNHDSNAKTKVV
ncbi:hypothetical protein [Wolbachia endosymbiont of Psylliodes chrysocephala]|uniref:hypothetical protein n=1 Tax=Wolbachia endosymbiont of Psylliodes chrysocephala TaxID=2883236 RepID=UPI00209D755B|nr:hypothetical protein [Wolbachia endosymbiont of Psylliodes chrysocephala]